MYSLSTPSLTSRRGQKKTTRRTFLKTCLPVILLLLFLLALRQNFAILQDQSESTVNVSTPNEEISSGSAESVPAFIQEEKGGKENEFLCQLRQYPPHRYYHHALARSGNTAQSFLNSETEYIFGEWPVLLSSETSTLSMVPRKLCVDQAEWFHPHQAGRSSSSGTSSISVLPFADGTNPSILSIDRIQPHLKSGASAGDAGGILKIIAGFPEAAYVVTLCMTNSQCSWKDSPDQMADFKISNQTEPDVVLTVLQILSKDFSRLAQSTLVLELDAPWGLGKKRKRFHEEDSRRRKQQQFGDARLFLHDGNVWISYREGKLFGFESQVLNPIHWEVDDTKRNFVTYVKASETRSFCCGRNMALMENKEKPHELLSLTWVDPVTVEKVSTTPHSVLYHDSDSVLHHNRNDRRDLRGTAEKNARKSHIHGTNAFMVYIPESKEYLGIGHFHRPNDRKMNPFARFGHHYTHTWFTISALPPHRLTGLSREFLLTSRSSRNSHATSEDSVHDDDAHIIQFLSGLELVDGDSQIVVAYGINDCEAAVTTLYMVAVRNMLRPVEAGKEVLDYMMPLQDRDAQVIQPMSER